MAATLTEGVFEQLDHHGPSETTFLKSPGLRMTHQRIPKETRGASLGILRMPSWEGADVIGRIYGSGRLRKLSELLMDLEDDRYARTFVSWLARRDGARALSRSPRRLGPRSCRWLASV
jgi:hypothetical protein